MVKENKNYKLIDVEGLSVCLAEDAWKEDTKQVHLDDLYEVSVIIDPITGKLEVVKEVRAFWAMEFFNLKQVYEELIDHYTINNTSDAISQEESTPEC